MIRLPQHIASNVSRGFEPARGAGFQTVALSTELVGSPDLACLEEMAPYYEASRSSHETGELPVRELSYRLPSGSIAVTRIEDWGTDPHGRAGNSLAHSVVVPTDTAAEGRWDPLSLIDLLVQQRPDRLPEPGNLEPLRLSALPDASQPQTLSVAASWLEALLGRLVGSARGKPVLLIAPARQARNLLRALAWGLPSRELQELSFATHFYRACDAHRSRFRIVTIASESEGPVDQDPYALMHWPDPTSTGEPDAPPAFGLLARRLAAMMAAGDWPRVQQFNRCVDLLRRGERVDLPAALDPEDVGALWEASGPALAPVLLGRPGLIADTLELNASNGALAAALLEAGGPHALCGASGRADAPRALRALEGAAGRSAWRAWSARWADELMEVDPEGSTAGAARPWWAVWRR